MTRITNFGRKRTYLEASSNDQDDQENISAGAEASGNGPATETDADIAAPPKKKRKRTKPSMRDGNTGVKAAEAALEREKKILEAEARAASGETAPLTKSAKKRLRECGKKEKALKAPPIPPSEWRRQKRIDEKLVATTCYACRKTGHAAKDCPEAAKLPSEDGEKAKATGICYSALDVAQRNTPFRDARNLPTHLILFLLLHVSFVTAKGT
ncbi:hypothetical protein C0991_001486 [Blastosporella zonata]|nr:hypothetical protein C0991_001486 [Blastosporella zonata]